MVQDPKVKALVPVVMVEEEVEAVDWVAVLPKVLVVSVYVLIVDTEKHIN
jgi:hypothetical protein